MKLKKSLAMIIACVMLLTVVFCVPVSAVFSEPSVDTEVGAICKFLNTVDYLGVPNSEKLACSASDPATWISFLQFSSVTGAITAIYMDGKEVGGTLDVSGFDSLVSVYATFNNLNAIYVDGCEALETLACSVNLIKELRLSGCPSIVEVYAESNMLTYFGVTDASPDFTRLHLSYNSIKSIDFTNLTTLKELLICCNRFDTIDISSLTDLEILDVSGNGLSGIDVEMLGSLSSLNVSSNSISSLSIPSTAPLTRLNIEENCLTGTLDLTAFTLDELLTNNSGLSGIDAKIQCDGTVSNLSIRADSNTRIWVSAYAGIEGEPGMGEYYLNAESNNGYEFSGWFTSSEPETLRSDFALYSFSGIPNVSYTAKSSAMQSDEYNTAELAALRTMLQTQDELGVSNYTKLSITADSPVEDWDFARFGEDGRVKSLSFPEDGVEQLYGELNLTGFTSLEWLYASSNRFTGINLTGCTQLMSVYCPFSPTLGVNNGVTLGNNDMLSDLHVAGCQLTSIDLTQAPNLSSLNISYNRITNGSYNLEFLTSLYMSENPINGPLDLSGCASLYLLDASDCGITSLAISPDATITSLSLLGNGMTGALDLSSNTQLEDADLSGNCFSSLSLSLLTDSGVATVSATASGNGGVGFFRGYYWHDVIDVQDYICGFIATPEQDSMLLGWYQNGTPVSNEENFIISGEEDCTVTAQFANKELNAAEAAAIEAFMQQGTDGSTNYDALGVQPGTSPDTWTITDSEGRESNVFEFNALGRVSSINLYSTGVCGQLNLANFTELTNIDVSECGLITGLNITGCSKLKSLNIAASGILQLDLSDCPLLNNLNISSTLISDIDLSGLYYLVYLTAEHTPLAELDISNNLILKELWLNGVSLDRLVVVMAGAPTEFSGLVKTSVGCAIDENGAICVNAIPDDFCGFTGWHASAIQMDPISTANPIMSADVGAINAPVFMGKSQEYAPTAQEMDMLRAFFNQVDYIGCTNLSKLPGYDIDDYKTWNNVRWVEVGGSLYVKEISLYIEGLAGVLDLSGMTCLDTLNIEDASLSELRLNGCTGLKYLTCINVPLYELDLSDCTGLREVHVTNAVNYEAIEGGLGDRMILPESAPELNVVWLDNNNITSLTIPELPSLSELSLCENSLEQLDLSTAVNLDMLNVEGNNLSTLDVSGHRNLRWLSCSRMPALTALNVNGCYSLSNLFIEETGLSGALDYSGFVFEVFRSTGTTVNSIRFGGYYKEETKGLSFETDSNAVITGVIFGSEWDNTLNKDVPAFYVTADGGDDFAFNSWVDTATQQTLYDGDKLLFEELLNNSDMSVTATSRTITLNAEEIRAISAFLSQIDENGLQNSYVLGVDANNETTWGGFVTWSKENISEINIESFGNLAGGADLSDFAKLESLRLVNSGITSLIVSNCPKLKRIECWDNNSLSTLVFADSNAIEEVYIGGGAITELDVSTLLQLRNLDVSNNPLETLTLNGCSNLESLRINKTLLTEFNFDDGVLMDFSAKENHFTNVSFTFAYGGREVPIHCDTQANTEITDVMLGWDFDEQTGMNYDEYYVVADAAGEDYVRGNWYDNVSESDVVATDGRIDISIDSVDRVHLTATAQYVGKNSAEITALNNFFNTVDGSGVSNATKLEINADDINTWREYITWKHGRVTGIAIDLSNAGESDRLTGTLNLNGFAGLEELRLMGTAITGLDIENCPCLKKVDISMTSITSLSFNGTTAIEEFSLGESGVISLDMSTLTELNNLNLYWNESLVELDVHNCNRLEWVSLEKVALTGEMDLSGVNLTLLRIHECSLGAIRMRVSRFDGTVVVVDAGTNGVITDFNFGTDFENDYTVTVKAKSGYAFDHWLNTTDNSEHLNHTLDLLPLIWSGNVTLEAVMREAVPNRDEIERIRSFLDINVGGTTNGEKLGIVADDINTWEGKVTWVEENISEIVFDQQEDDDRDKIAGTLDVSGFEKLRRLSCTGTALTSVDASDCPELQELCCWNSRLTSLDFTYCPVLEHVDCWKNSITSLDFSGVDPLYLKNLKCSENLITSLDVTDYFLTILDTRDNPMESIMARSVCEYGGDVQSFRFVTLRSADENAYVSLFYDDFNQVVSLQACGSFAPGYVADGWYYNSDLSAPFSTQSDAQLACNTGYVLYLKSAEATVSGITVQNQPRLDYYAGDCLSLEGLSVEVTYLDADPVRLSSGFTTDYSTGNVLSYADGGKEITVTYKGFTAKTGTINIRDLRLDSTEDLFLVGGDNKNVSLLRQEFVARGLVESLDGISIKERGASEEYTGIIKTGLVIAVTGSSPEPFDYSMTLVLLGDPVPNGATDSDDVNMIMRAAVGCDASEGGIDSTDEATRWAADISRNGDIDALDALFAEMIAYGLKER